MSIPVIPSASSAEALDRFLAAQGFDYVARAAVLAALAASPAAAPPVPWETFELELFEQYGPSLRSKGTLRCIKHAARVLRELGVTSPADLDIRLITKLVASRDPKLSPNTVKGLLVRVQSVCTHAVNFGYLDVSPFVKRPIRTWVRGTKPKGVRHLTKIQMAALLSTPWTQGSRGQKPLHRLQSVAQRAGIEIATFHVLRRTVATNMEANGAAASQIQRQLRHSDVSTTQNYYMQRDRDNMSRVMDGFGYD